MTTATVTSRLGQPPLSVFCTNHHSLPTPARMVTVSGASALSVSVQNLVFLTPLDDALKSYEPDVPLVWLLPVPPSASPTHPWTTSEWHPRSE